MNRVYGLGEVDESRYGDWMCTYTGRRFWPLDPRPEDFDVIDIAHALSMVPRYAGHAREFYSVAEHSVLAAQIALEVFDEQTALVALYHDAAEAYIGDMVRPLKVHPLMGTYRLAEGLIMAKVWDWLGVIPMDFIMDRVNTIDHALLSMEAHELMPPESVGTWTLYDTTNFHPKPVFKLLPPGEAKATFLSMHSQLT